MSSLYSYVFFPVRARTLENFSAPDPWHGGKPATWTFEVFRMVQPAMEQVYKDGKRPVPQTGEGARLGQGEVLGVRNQAEGRLRQLPLALSQLWQEGAVKTQDLPRLMAAVESGLGARDYYFPNARLFRFLYMYMVGVAVIWMVGSLYLHITFFVWLAAALAGFGVYGLYQMREWGRRSAQTRAAALMNLV